MTASLSRRSLLMLGAAGVGALALGPGRALANTGAWQRVEAAAAIVGDRLPIPEGLALELPLVSENGASVPLAVGLDERFAEDPVRTLHLFAPANPDPGIAVFQFGEQAGRAQVATRVRLNQSQTVIALAETESGAVRVAERAVRVTTSGCLMVDDTYATENVFQTRIRTPEALAAGQAGEVLTMINHPMETGLREDASGNILPKRIIEQVEASLDGEPFFIADLNRSVSANPYLRFLVAPRQSGTLELRWTEDTGESVEETAAISVG